MSVQVARHAGFCMGVRRAVLEAMKAANTEKDIATIGELVHNPEVIRKLSEIGIHGAGAGNSAADYARADHPKGALHCDGAAAPSL